MWPAAASWSRRCARGRQGRRPSWPRFVACSGGRLAEALPPPAMLPFATQPPRGYKLDNKTFVGDVRFLDKVPNYLPTDDAGVAFVLRRAPGQSPEAALEKLCDNLGGTRTGGIGINKRASRGGWTSTLTLYGKEEATKTISRTCVAPLVCPKLPAAQRFEPYKMPNEEDPVLKAAITAAELERDPIHRMRVATLALYHAHAGKACPYMTQNYEDLGASAPQRCRGVETVKPCINDEGRFFMGCTKYNYEAGHRGIKIPASVDASLLEAFLKNPTLVVQTEAMPWAARFFMESRWARAGTCPLESGKEVTLVYEGVNLTGACPVKLKAYTFTRAELSQFTILVVTGTHTHPRAIRTVRLGHLRSQVFDLLDQNARGTRAELAARIRNELGLTPNSSALKHALADYKLANNPLGEDEVGIMAQRAANQRSNEYVRKVVLRATAGVQQTATYSYVIFYSDDMIEMAVLQTCFCADLSFKDFDRLARPTNTTGEWHLFSISAWTERLHKNLTVFKTATLGECTELYYELFAEFLRACATRGQLMPTLGSAINGRTPTTVRTKELIASTIDFCAAQAQGAAKALADQPALANPEDPVRAFLRGCALHVTRCARKQPLDRDGADRALWDRERSAPTGCHTDQNAENLLAALRAHTHPQVREWGSWAARPLMHNLIFPSVYSRLDAALLRIVPTSTNT